MPELATAWVTLTARTKDMEGDIKRSLNRVDGSGAGRQVGQQFSTAAARSADFTAVERKMADAGRRGSTALTSALKVGLAGIATGAATAGVAGIATVLSRGFDRLKTIDSARFKLQALGNDADTVKTIMDSALKSVKGTAFSMGDAATAASSAVAAGVKPGEQLTKYLSSVGDAAAVAGTEFTDMASIFNKVRANGVAYTDDLQQLQDRGLPVMQLLRDKYKVTGEEFKKMVQDGKVSAADFEEVLTTKLGGAAQKMGDSFEGSMMNLQASTARLGANFLTAIFGGDGVSELAGPTEAVKVLTTKFDEMGAWVTANGPQIRKVFTDVRDAVVGISDAVRGVIGFLGNMGLSAGDVVVAFAAWKTIQGVSSLATSISGISTGLGGLPGKANSAAGGINSALAAITIPAALYQFLNSNAQQLHQQWDDAYWKRWEQDQREVAAGRKPAQPGVGDPGGAPAAGQGNLPSRPAQPPVRNQLRDRIAAGQLPGFSIGPNGVILGPDGKPAKLPDGFATGGPVFGAGTATSDSIAAFLSNGEHVLTAKDVSAMGGQGGVYAFRNALHRAGGGDVPWMAGQVPRFPEKPRGKAGNEAGGRPDLRPGPGYPGIIGLPDWSQPGTKFGPPPLDWFNKPVNPDDVLFPDAVAPGDRNRQKEIWEKLRPKVKPLGFAGGGSVDGSAAWELAQSASGRKYSYGGTGGVGNTGLYDCSGFMSDIYAALTGKPYTGNERYFTTESDFKALGFVEGFDPNSAFNIGVRNGGGGPNSHMAGTLFGANVESGSKGTLLGGGAKGANDPSFGKQYHLPGVFTAGSDAGQGIIQDYTEGIDQGSRDEADKLAENKTGGMDGSSLGQSIVGGMLQSIGLDGSVFSNPLEWPNVKSAMALANYGGGLLKGALGGGEEGTGSGGGVGGGMASSIGLPNITDFIKPMGAGALTPNAPHEGTGAAPGPLVQYNGPVNMGVDPRAATQRQSADMNQAYRKNMTAVKPG